MASAKLSLLATILLAIALIVNAKITDEAQAKQFLEDLDPEYLRAANKGMKVRWQYITDVTDANLNAMVNRSSTRSSNKIASSVGFPIQVESNSEFLAFQKETWNQVQEYDWSGFSDDVKREFEYLNIIGPAALPEEQAKEVID